MNNSISQPIKLSQADHERIFFQSTLNGNNSGWFISLNSKRAYGPFPDRDVAEYILDGLLKRAAARRAQKSTDQSNDQSSSNVA